MDHNTCSSQTHTESEIYTFLHTVSDVVNRLQQQVEQNDKEIHFWKEECELLKHRMSQMEKELERGEESRVKNNLLFFGIAESNNQKENCVDIVNKILTTHYPVGELDGGCGIRGAFRLGKQQSEQGSKYPRPILVTFSSWKNVMTVLGNKKGRGALKLKGISVSQQKTKRQQNVLQRMKSQGRTGFFHKGQLYERKEGRAVRCTDFDVDTNQKKRRGNFPSWFGQPEQEAACGSHVNQPDAKRDIPPTPNSSRKIEAASERQGLDPPLSVKKQRKEKKTNLAGKRSQDSDDSDVELIDENLIDTLLEYDFEEDPAKPTKKEKEKNKVKIQTKMKELGLRRNGLKTENHCPSKSLEKDLNAATVDTEIDKNQTNCEKFYPISKYFVTQPTSPHLHVQSH